MCRWYPSPAVDAQACHLLAGWGIVGWGVAFGWPAWAAWAVIVGWAAVKEFVFDLIVERDGLFGSTLDAAMYLTGGLLGSLTGLARQWM